MEPIAVIGVAVVLLIISIAIIRSVLRINEQVENQETMIRLLGQSLLQQGLTVEEVRKILNPKLDKLKGK